MAKEPLSKSRRCEPSDTNMDMTPMIDVTFLILIFFMCTLKFKTLEGQLGAYLPPDVGVNPTDAAEAPEPLDVGIHVRIPGTKLTPAGELWNAGSGTRFVFAEDRRVDYSIGPRHGLSLPELQAQLASLDPSAYEHGVALTPGPETVQGEAIAVIDALIERGIHAIRITGAR